MNKRRICRKSWRRTSRPRNGTPYMFVESPQASKRATKSGGHVRPTERIAEIRAAEASSTYVTDEGAPRWLDESNGYFSEEVPE